MTRRLLATVVGVSLIAGVSGCTTPLQLLDQTKPLPNNYRVVGGEVMGESSEYSVFGFSFGDGGLHAAVSDAVSKGGGDALVGVAADVVQWNIIFFRYLKTTVWGTPVQSGMATAAPAPAAAAPIGGGTAPAGGQQPAPGGQNWGQPAGGQPTGGQANPWGQPAGGGGGGGGW